MPRPLSLADAIREHQDQKRPKNWKISADLDPNDPAQARILRQVLIGADTVKEAVGNDAIISLIELLGKVNTSAKEFESDIAEIIKIKPVVAYELPTIIAVLLKKSPGDQAENARNFVEAAMLYMGLQDNEKDFFLRTIMPDVNAAVLRSTATLMSKITFMNPDFAEEQTRQQWSAGPNVFQQQCATGSKTPHLPEIVTTVMDVLSEFIKSESSRPRTAGNLKPWNAKPGPTPEAG